MPECLALVQRADEERPRRPAGHIPGAWCFWLAVVTVLLGSACGGPAQVLPAEERQQAPVERIVDGDTIVVRLGANRERLRYIGVDAPELPRGGEPAECFAREAAQRNEALVEGKVVALEKDVSEIDRFGRLLRYVYLGELMVNAELVRGGFAKAVRYPPDVRHHDLLARLERDARAARRGLWGRCERAILGDATRSAGRAGSGVGMAELTVLEADITQLDVDAVVNAANDHLWMGGGVAGAIKRAGGHEIEDEAVRQGPSAVGEAVVTGAGRLKARYVIHAITMGQDLRTSADVIRRATRSALRRAKELSLRSIAVPALGTGVGGFPLTACAQVMVQAARDETSAGSLERVIFAVRGEEARRAFAAALARAT